MQFQSNCIDNFSFHFFVQCKEFSDETIGKVLQHVLCSFPTLRILLIWHLMQKRFRPPFTLKLRASDPIDWKLISSWFLQVSMPERPKKALDSQALQCDLAFLKLVQNCAIEAYMQIHTCNSKLYLSHQEHEEICRFNPKAIPSNRE